MSSTYAPTLAADCSVPHLSIVREHRGSNGEAAGYVARRDAAYALLETALTKILALPVDGPDEDELRAERRRLQPLLDRGAARRMAISGQLEQLAIRQAGPGREQQGLSQARSAHRDDTKQDPTDAKRDGQTGRHLADDPAMFDAVADGKLPTRHAALLTKTLQELGPVHPKHGWLRQRLLAAGAVEDVRTFGRTCRRLLAQTDVHQAQRKVDRQHATRKLNLVVQDDGVTRLSGQGGGFDAEIVHTAIHAFEQLYPNDRRSPDKRRWDALVAACKASLDAAKAPANRGARPHVLVTVKQPTDGADPAVVEGAWTGPIPWTEARRHLVNAGMSGVLLNANDAPMSVSQTVRTVPAGLWKALQVRDQVCIGQGCDVPAAWCQVMHLETPYRLDGKLDLANAAPGCSYHHKMLDHHGWHITWHRSKPVLHPPDRDPPPEEPNRNPTPARAKPARAKPDRAEPARATSGREGSARKDGRRPDRAGTPAMAETDPRGIVIGPRASRRMVGNTSERDTQPPPAQTFAQQKIHDLGPP